MTEIPRSQLFDRAVELVAKQGDHLEAWVGRMVTVHAGLAGAVGLAVSWKGLPLDTLVSAVVLVLSALAIMLSVLMLSAVLRHHAWGSAYIESAKLIEGDEPLLFRDNMVKTCAPRTVTFFAGVTAVLILAWSVTAVLAIISWASAA